MQVLTWNIQAGVGVDGRFDLDRIATVIRAMGDPDVICLQEVGCNLPDTQGDDQVMRLAKTFSEHTAVFGPAIDRLTTDTLRLRFGNLVLSRLPVIQCFRHPLPQPRDASTQHMPRQATEVVLEASWGAVRVVTTHLEFHSQAQRTAQVERLMLLQSELRDALSAPSRPGAGLYAPCPRPPSTVLCGDFNFEKGDVEYAMLTSDPYPTLDAWTVVHPTLAHTPTCGIYDRAQWPQGPHCRDFFFVTEDLATRVHDVQIDTQTNASDHQPLLLTLGDG